MLKDKVSGWVVAELRRMIRSAANAFRIFVQESIELLRLDIPSGLIVLAMLALMLPIIGGHADNAMMLRAFVDDEPLITMQVDGMSAWPWGNPANYLKPGVAIPAHWFGLNYSGLVYYGGLYPGLAWLIWLPLKAAGFAIFPTLPIVLRSVTLLFAVFTLLAAYNFGRRHFGIVAGVFASLVLLSEFHFFWISAITHPDTLLYFLSFLGLALAIRHAQDGTIESLVALAITIGLAQGAKLGGPLFAPIALASILVAANGYISIGMRCAALGAVAVVAFFATTPYAFLDSYYWQSWASFNNLVHSGLNYYPAAIGNWLSMSLDRLGIPLVAAGATGIFLVQRRLPFFFALLLGVTVFFWYAALQKLWVQLQYVLVSFSILAMFAGSLFGRHLVVGAIAAAIIFVPERFEQVARVREPLRDWRDSDLMRAGIWFGEHVSGQPTVLFDTYAYFDPEKFPNQTVLAHPVRYVDLEKYQPEYFSIYLLPPFNFMSIKMKTERLDRWDASPYNMRLYQDLLGTDPENPVVREVPFVKFLGSFGRVYLFKFDASALQREEDG